MFPVDTTSTANAVLTLSTAILIGLLWSSRRNTPVTFFVGLLLGVGVVVSGLHPFNQTPLDLCLSFALYPVESPAGKLVVVAFAVTGLIVFLLWSKGAASNSFFLGTLAGAGFIASTDIVLLHWIFGLHRLTNTDMDIVLEPLLVLLGLSFLWFGITREFRYRPVA